MIKREMPHLVQGHVRFTEEDFLLTDYQESALSKNKTKSYRNLAAQLKDNSEQLVLMKDPEIVELFNTQKNIKQLLSSSLSVIIALAEREGCSLSDLLKS